MCSYADKEAQKGYAVKETSCKGQELSSQIGYTKQKRCEYDDFKSQSSRYCDKNCQEKENTVMWSVTKEMDIQLAKPAIRRLCSDKNCQSTRCYQKRRPMYSYDKTVNNKE